LRVDGRQLAGENRVERAQEIQLPVVVRGRVAKDGNLDVHTLGRSLFHPAVNSAISRARRAGRSLTSSIYRLQEWGGGAATVAELRLRAGCSRQSARISVGGNPRSGVLDERSGQPITPRNVNAFSLNSSSTVLP
jgi:hypothetical protein